MPARQQHNPCQLKCTLGCNRWFKTASGRTRHIRSFHTGITKTAIHPQRPSHAEAHHDFNTDEGIQSSPPPDDTISYVTASPQNSHYTPRSRLSTLDVRDSDAELPIFDDPFYINANGDPPFNNDPPFNDDPLSIIVYFT